MSEEPATSSAVGLQLREEQFSVDEVALERLEEARRVGQRFDPWLLMTGLGGPVVGLVFGGITNLLLPGALIAGAAFLTMVVGKVVQKVVSRKKQLELGFTQDMVARVDEVMRELPSSGEEARKEAARLLSGRAQ